MKDNESRQGSVNSDPRILLENERRWIMSQIFEMEKEVGALPTGRLYDRYVKGNHYIYIYESAKNLAGGQTRMKSRQRIARPEDAELIVGIRRRCFIEGSLQALRENLKQIERFNAEYMPYDSKRIQNTLGEIYKIADPNNDDNEETADDRMAINDTERTWDASSEGSTAPYAERRVLKTQNGEKVRSKSEALIACVLGMSGVDYEYEKPIRICGGTFYPDFTIENERTGEIFYWEHFGMLNDERYLRKTKQKLAVYMDGGILPWKNLITTFEDGANAIDLAQIQRIVDAFLR